MARSVLRAKAEFVADELTKRACGKAGGQLSAGYS
jgi:hypothetical protein